MRRPLHRTCHHRLSHHRSSHNRLSHNRLSHNRSRRSRSQPSMQMQPVHANIQQARLAVHVGAVTVTGTVTGSAQEARTQTLSISWATGLWVRAARLSRLAIGSCFHDRRARENYRRICMMGIRHGIEWIRAGERTLGALNMSAEFGDVLSV